MLKHPHPVWLETVTMANIAMFTLLQFVVLAGVYAITWAGIAGILFPVPILLLIPARQYIMPRLFDAWTLSQLDAAGAVSTRCVCVLLHCMCCPASLTCTCGPLNP